MARRRSQPKKHRDDDLPLLSAASEDLKPAAIKKRRTNDESISDDVTIQGQMTETTPSSSFGAGAIMTTNSTRRTTRGMAALRKQQTDQQEGEIQTRNEAHAAAEQHHEEDQKCAAKTTKAGDAATSTMTPKAIEQQSATNSATLEQQQLQIILQEEVNKVPSDDNDKKKEWHETMSEAKQSNNAETLGVNYSGLCDNTTTVLHPSYRDGLTEEQAKAIGAALVGNTSVEKCWIWESKRLTLPAVQHLCQGLLQSQVKVMAMDGVFQQDDPHIRQCIYQMIETSPSLTTLSVRTKLDSSMIRLLGQTLQSNSRLKELVFERSWKPAKVHDAKALALVLTQSHLQKLTFSFEDITPKDGVMPILFKGIQQCMKTSLEYLDISDFRHLQNAFWLLD